jgi:glycosyltransferase involved in cell wall biosynthesis
VLAVSEPLARRAEQLLRLPAGAVGVARLPLPLDLGPTPVPDSQPRRLLAAGRASIEKGFDVLIDALARPAAAGWNATLVTEGPERSRLIARARSAGLDERVTFQALRPRAELFDLVRAHHAVVVPSRTEGLGMMALEALALGRPVVASAVGGLVEVVSDGVDGLLVPPGDADALAHALARLELRTPGAEAVAHHQAAAVVEAHAGAYGFAVPSLLPVRRQ